MITKYYGIFKTHWAKMNYMATLNAERTQTTPIKSKVRSSISKSEMVATLSKPARKELRKARAQSGKRVKNQHEVVMASYITDAKIQHAKPKPSASERAERLAKRNAWLVRKPSMQKRKGIETIRDRLVKEEQILPGEVSVMVEVNAELEEAEEGPYAEYSVKRLNPLYDDYYGDFEWQETYAFRKFAKTYDPIAFRGSFSDYMRLNFPEHYRKICEEEDKKRADHERICEHGCRKCNYGDWDYDDY